MMFLIKIIINEDVHSIYFLIYVTEETPVRLSRLEHLYCVVSNLIISSKTKLFWKFNLLFPISHSG